MNIIKIGNVVKIYKGRKASNISKTYLNNYYRFIQIDDLRNDINLKYTDSKGIHVTQDDIIIAWDGANAGTIGYGLSGVIGSTLAKLTLNTDKIIPEYLGRFLKSKSKYLKNTSIGATIPHISGQALANLQIPLPSLNTQKKVIKTINQAENVQKKKTNNLSFK